jgi:predicted GNAT superfamily acetyltransferase
VPVEPVRIRPVTDDDLDRVLEINQANVPEVGPIDAQRLRFLIDESTLSLVVDVDGEPAGFCVVLPLGSHYASVNYRWFVERYDDVAYLDRVAFHAAFRRRGLGSALYADVERRLASLDGVGALALEVNVDPPNPGSLAFHASHGFVEVGRQDTPYGITVAMMRKPLSAGPA